MRKNLIARSVAAALALSLVAAACASDEAAEEEPTEETTEDTTEETTESTEAEAEEEAEETEEKGDEEALGTAVDVAAGNEDFSILVEAVTAADLGDALADESAELTVFAPTNEAFEAYLEAEGITKEELLASPELADILKYHVLDTKVDSAAALTAAEGEESVVTLQGAELPLSLDGESIKVGEATVITPDIEASNSVIHAIDTVLAPPA